MNIKNIKFIKKLNMHSITYLVNDNLYEIKIRCKEDTYNNILLVYIQTKCDINIIDDLSSVIHKNLYSSYTCDRIICLCKDENGLMKTRKRNRIMDEDMAIAEVINNTNAKINKDTTIINTPNSININKHDGYMSATMTKFFQNEDKYTYLLKLFNINSVEDMITFLCMADNEKMKLFSKNAYNEIMEFLLEKGLQYELFIINTIKERINNTDLSFIKIVNDQYPEYNKYNTYLTNTQKAMQDKIDIIYQGMIQTDSNNDLKLRGFPDLIISKRAFKYLFVNKIDKHTQTHIEAFDKLNEEHILADYLIVDIKSSTAILNIDGMTLRNSGLLKSYKSQLAVYGYIMNDILHNQDYPMQHVGVYILPHNIKMSSASKINSFTYDACNPISNDKLFVAKIDLEGLDLDYYIKLGKTYNNYSNCIEIYTNTINKVDDYKIPITFLYDKQIEFLRKLSKTDLDDYIKCNKLLPINIEDIENIDFDNKYMPFVRTNMGDYLDIKIWLSKQTRSIMLVRGFTQKIMENLHDNNITSYLQTNKLLNVLTEINNKNGTDIEIPYAIISANDAKYNKILYCDDIKTKYNQFHKKIMNTKIKEGTLKDTSKDIVGKKILLCLDFETISNKLITNMCKKKFDFNINEDYDDFGSGQKVFMIGCNSFINNNSYLEPLENKQYILDKIVHDTLDTDIELLFIELQNFIEYNIKKYNVKHDDIGFIIWSNFEISVLKTIKNVNNNLSYDSVANIYKLYGIEIIDIMALFTSYPLLSVKGAFDYSIKSIANAYYQHNLIEQKDIWDKTIKNGLDASYYALWYYNAKLHNDDKYEYYKGKFEDIVRYNDIDCSIMANIINITYKLLQK